MSSERKEFLQVGGRKKKHFCNYCKREITLHFYVKCAECDNIELCGDCFSSGVKFEKHEPFHNYRVIDCLETSIFTKDWSIHEELMLLEAIEVCGLGNWRNIADYMNGVGVGSNKASSKGSGSGSSSKEKEISLTSSGVSSKGSKEIEAHYYDVYMNRGYNRNNTIVSASEGVSPNGGAHYKQLSCDCFLPETYLVQDRSNNNVNPNKANKKQIVFRSTIDTMDAHPDPNPNGSEADTPYRYCCQCHVAPSSLPLHETEGTLNDLMPSSANANGNAAGNVSNNSEETVATLVNNLAGYMPLRVDFDYEYENDAEVLLADMEFHPTIIVSPILNNASAGAVVHGDPANYQFSCDNTYTNVIQEHPNEIKLKLQVINIYNKKLEERERRKRFAITTGLVDIKKQQHLERKGSKEEKDLISKLRLFSRFEPMQQSQPRCFSQGEEGTDVGNSTTASTVASSNHLPHQTLVDAVVRVRKLKKQIELLSIYRKLNITNIDDVWALEKKRKLGCTGAGIAASVSNGGGEHKNARLSHSDSGMNLSLGSRRRHSTSNSSLTDEMELQAQPQPTSKAILKLQNKPSSNASSKFNIQSLPGFNSLSSTEQDLCTSIQLTPSLYNSIKDSISR